MERRTLHLGNVRPLATLRRGNNNEITLTMLHLPPELETPEVHLGHSSKAIIMADTTGMINMLLMVDTTDTATILLRRLMEQTLGM